MAERTPWTGSPVLASTGDLAVGQAESVNECGDAVRMKVTLLRGRISDVEAEVRGCGTSASCAAAVARLARGLTPAEVHRRITPSRIVRSLEGFPPDHEHLARLVCEVLEAATRDAIAASREGWKRLYR